MIQAVEKKEPSSLSDAEADRAGKASPSQGHSPHSRAGGQWIRAAWQAMAIIAAATVIGLGVNSTRQGESIPLVADWSVKAQLAAAVPDAGENMIISLDEAQVLFYSKSATFIDARSEDIYQTGHIQGAISLPWEDYEARFDEVMASIPSDSVVITYCDGEACSLSKELAMVLLAKGYGKVRVLLNGWTAWVEANLPAEG